MTFYLGCVCFGFKPLSEMLFRKSGCLVVTENVFNIDCKIRATGRKIFSVVIFTSNHFRRRAKRERGRERRTHRRANREREIAPSNPRSRWSDRCPHPLHATVSALFIQAQLRSHTSTPAPARSIHKIGRASCRERV